MDNKININNFIPRETLDRVIKIIKNCNPSMSIFDIEDVVVNDVSPEWETREGKFTKRLAKMLKKKLGIEIPSNVMGIIGDLIKNSLLSEEIFYEITNKISWNPGDFGDDHSCFWGKRAGAKFLIEQNGGGAVLFYDKYFEPIGRCLFLPVKNGGSIFFNFYSARGGLLKPNLDFLAFLLGKIFPNKFIKKIALFNNGSAIKLLYINGGNGIYVTDFQHNNNALDLEISYKCAFCGAKNFSEGEIFDGKLICDDCHSSMRTCANCGDLIFCESFTDYDMYCEDCARKLNLVRCKHCGVFDSPQNMIEKEDQYVCEICFSQMYCYICGEFGDYTYIIAPHRVVKVCNMHSEMHIFCENCGYRYYIEEYNECPFCKNNTEVQNNIDIHPRCYFCNEYGEFTERLAGIGHVFLCSSHAREYIQCTNCRSFHHNTLKNCPDCGCERSSTTLDDILSFNILD